MTEGNDTAARQLRRAHAKARREQFENDLAFQIRAHRLPAPLTQHRFALEIDRQWRFDFAWREFMLAAEVEGGVWRPGGGAHSHPTNIVRDIEKHNDAALLGWHVLRLTTDAVKNGQAIALLERAFHAKGWTRGEPRSATMTTTGDQARLL